jgi:hypothetical protein
MTVTLFNRGKRTIVGAHPGKFEKGKLDKRGNPMPLKFSFKPETAMAFNEETGAKLQRLYPGEVLSVRDVQKQFEVIEEASPEEPAAKPQTEEAVQEPAAQPAEEPTEKAPEEGETKSLLNRVLGS